MIKEFKEFILRGNVVDLAVGVAIGAAFGAIVSSLVSEIFSPIVGLLPIPDLRDAAIDLAPNGAPAGDIRYGIVLNNVISFLVTATVIFFLVVKPINHLMGRTKKEEHPPEMRECPHCLTSIKTAATVCAACGREVPRAT
jgi:large conductance mechanosensitive channel